MAQRYEISAEGLAGIPYRIDIYDDTYTGSTVTQLNADRQFFALEGGRAGRDPEKPVWVKEARIFVRDDVDLSPLFGLPDRDARVEVYRTDTGNEVFRGFLLTDFFRDAPFEDIPAVELRAIDGLKLLQGQTLDEVFATSTDTLSYSGAISEILGELYPNPPNVRLASEWYPDASALTSSDDPLQSLRFAYDNYRDDRPDGDLLSLWDVLNDLLIGQGLTLKQAQFAGESIKWLAYQRSAIDSSGDLTYWTYDPDTGNEISGPTTQNIENTLTGEPFVRQHGREFEQRWQSFAVTHDHVPVQQLVTEGGFEDQGAEWSLNTTQNLTVQTRDHDNISPTPPATQQNQYVLRVTEETTASPSIVEIAASQFLGTVEGVPPRSYGRLSLKEESNADLDIPHVTVRVGSWYLTSFTTAVRQSVKKGTGSIPVDPIDRPIPKGAKLPFGGSDPTEGTITLNERAEEGADELVGEISKDVSDTWSVRYPGFTNSSSDLKILFWKFRDGYVEHEWLFEWVDDSGNILSGDTEIQIRAERDTDLGAAHFDDVRLSLERNGQPLDQTTSIAEVPEFGQRIGTTTRTTQGPSSTNLSRIRGNDPNGNDFRPQNWGIGAGGGSLTLEQLHAREWLRYFRNHRERLSLTFQSRAGGPVLSGHELVTFEGSSYTISQMRYQPQTGDLEVELLKREDGGTSGIVYLVSLSQSDNVSLSSGGGSSSASGGSATAVEWDDITGGPTTLFARNGASDGFSETIALASEDVTDPLALDNSTLRVNTNFSPDSLQVKGGRSIISGPRGDDFATDDFDNTDFSTDGQPALEVDESFRFVWTQRHIWERGTGEDAQIIRNTQYGDELIFGTDDQDRFRVQLYENTKDRPRSFIQADPRNLDVTYTGYREYVPGFLGQGIKLTDNAERKPDFLEVTHGSFRGTLRVKEFIVSQTTVETGPHAISPGGGKVAEFRSSNHTSVSNTFTNTTQQEWDFENDNEEETYHGLAVGDRVFAQRFNPDSQAVIAQIRAVVDEVVGPHVVKVTINSDFTVPNIGQDVEGYDVFVVGSTDTGRDSLIYDNPYDPSREILDGISDFTDWDSRGGKLRFMHGNLAGRYDYTSETYGMAGGDPNAEYISADASKGVRIRDGANGRTLAQLSGTALTLGAQRQIRFDPSGTPEAQIDGTLEMSASGDITNANTDFLLDSDALGLNGVDHTGWTGFTVSKAVSFDRDLPSASFNANIGYDYHTNFSIGRVQMSSDDTIILSSGQADGSGVDYYPPNDTITLYSENEIDLKANKDVLVQTVGSSTTTMLLRGDDNDKFIQLRANTNSDPPAAPSTANSARLYTWVDNSGNIALYAVFSNGTRKAIVDDVP